MSSALFHEQGAAAFSAIVTAHARQRPESPAIVDRHGTYSFAQLESAVASRADELNASEVPPNAIVGITAEREFETLANLLGVVRARRVPLLLDRLYPRSYARDRLEQVRAAAVISRNEPARLSGDRHEWTILADEDAYVTFTSGTSGKPQAVVASWAALDNYVKWAPETFGDIHLSRFALVSGLGHDPLWRDLLTPLLLGATLFVPSSRQWASGAVLAAFLIDHEIQAFSCTPTQMSVIAQSTPAGTAPALRRVLLGGEPLMPKTVSAARRWAPAARLFNVYGLTETPQVAAFNEICAWNTTGSGPLPIGSPAPGFIFTISELRTLQVASGPIARAVIDSDGHVHALNHPFDTGDLAHREGAAFVVSGRRDRVLNVRGARVDLTMIEFNIMTIGGVTACRVRVDEDVLAALVVVDSPDSGLTAELIRRSLSKTVPLSHIPSRVDFVTRNTTITPNGKIS